MTIEEAIDVLTHNYPSECYTELCNAVDIAVEWLSVLIKIMNIGKEGKELRIYIGGRLFAVRELAQ